MNGIDMKLVRLALEEYVSNHRVDEDKNKEWNAFRLGKILENLSTPCLSGVKLSHKGGEWLGVAREWIQRRYRNGDSVNFGSDDVLEGNIREIEIEWVASEIAAAAINEFFGLNHTEKG
jgi:hypothetical protein